MESLQLQSLKEYEDLVIKLKGLKYSQCNRLHRPLAKVLVGALFPTEALLATPRRPEYGGADGIDGGLPMAGLMLGLIMLKCLQATVR